MIWAGSPDGLHGQACVADFREITPLRVARLLAAPAQHCVPNFILPKREVEVAVTSCVPDFKGPNSNPFNYRIIVGVFRTIF
jgi:hypothetical protein